MRNFGFSILDFGFEEARPESQKVIADQEGAAGALKFAVKPGAWPAENDRAQGGVIWRYDECGSGNLASR
jgi:hypothetical protein